MLYFVCLIRTKNNLKNLRQWLTVNQNVCLQPFCCLPYIAKACKEYYATPQGELQLFESHVWTKTIHVHIMSSRVVSDHIWWLPCYWRGHTAPEPSLLSFYLKTSWEYWKKDKEFGEITVTVQKGVYHESSHSPLKDKSCQQSLITEGLHVHETGRINKP